MFGLFHLFGEANKEITTMLDDGRKEDIRIISEAHAREKDPGRKRDYSDMLRSIRNEGKAIKDMRQALVKAHREGNKAEIKDIHDFIKGKEKYGQRGHE